MVVDSPTPVADRAPDIQEPHNRSGSNRAFFVLVLHMIGRITARLNARFPFTLSLKVLAFVLAVSWYALLPVRLTSVLDPDLGWHMRSGEWIMQHHQLPHTDPFSATGVGKLWIAYSWPFGVFIYEVAKNFDLLGVAAYTLLAWMATVTAVFILIRGQGAGFWRAIGLTVVVGIIAQIVISPRPGTITILLFIILLHLLLRERQKGYTKTLWFAPPIIWAWSNVHVQFVYGLFLIGVFCIEPVLDRVFLSREHRHKSSARLWAVLAVSAVATLLNPYGFGPYQVILDFIHQPLLGGLVVETMAMPFTTYLDFTVLFITLGAAYALGRRKVVSPVWIILMGWAATSAFRMQRDVWLVGVLAAAIIAERPDEEPAPPRESSRLWLYGTVGVLIVIFAMLERVPSNKYLLSLIARVMPVGAVAYIHEHHLPGPIFNDYDWGGFLIYAVPDYPVAIDGRTNIHGQDEVIQSHDTWYLLPGWDQNPLLTKANLVVGSPDKPLTNYLRKDPHFKVLYDDGTCVLFQRISPGLG